MSTEPRQQLENAVALQSLASRVAVAAMLLADRLESGTILEHDACRLFLTHPDVVALRRRIG